MSRVRKFAAVALLGTLVALLGACGKSPTTPATGPPSAQTVRQALGLSEAEMRFGVSPTRNKDVVYQPDVIVMEHGADAIRSYSSNGMTWTIDASAPHAAEIQPDKILFATGRAVGRVLAVERKGNDLDVTLGPVELTDIIEEAHISYHGALDPEKMIAYYAPDYPGTYTDLDAPRRVSSIDLQERPSVEVVALSATGEIIPVRAIVAGTEGSYRTAVWTDADRAQFRILSVAGVPAAGIGPPADIGIKDFQFSPNCCGGLGVVQKYKKDGLEFKAYAVLTLDKPEFTFRLDILHGLKTAEIEMTGLGGVKVGFNGRTNANFHNINAAFELPIDLSLPIGGLILPFSATFHQSIFVTTLFAAKEAVVNAAGEYEYGGTIKAGLSNGQLRATAPTMVGTKQNLAQNTEGVSLGVNGLVLGYGGKLIVGLGAWGAAVGPYLSVNTTVGVTRGSDTQVPIVGYTCRTAQLKMWLDYGVGYAIPAVVVEALNEFLSLFHAKKISATHGTSLGTISIHQSSEGVPPSCDKP